MTKEEYIKFFTEIKDELLEEGNDCIRIRNTHERPKKTSVNIKEEILSVISKISLLIGAIGFLDSDKALLYASLVSFLMFRLAILKTEMDYNEIMDACDEMDEVVNKVIPVMRENITKANKFIEFLDSCSEDEVQKYLNYKISE